MAATIRSATMGDRPSLEIIRRQAIEATFADTYDRSAYADTVATPDDRLPEWLSSDRYRAVLHETQITPVSYGVLDLQDADLLGLYTAPDYAREGHATAVLQALEAGLEAEVMTALVPELSEGFFAANGFVRRGDPSNAPIPRVPMHKPLDG